jgi:hypothetical protein
MIAAATMSAAASFYKFQADSVSNLSLISAHGTQRSQTEREKRQRSGLREDRYFTWGRAFPLPRIVPVPGIAISATPILISSDSSTSAVAFARSTIPITLIGPAPLGSA